MRVLLISGSYPPMKCGVGDYTRMLANALSAVNDLDVAVLTSESAAAAADTNTAVNVMACMSGWGIGNAMRAVRSVRLWRPDIVHVQFPTQGYGNGLLQFLLPAIGRLFGARVVQTWHEPTSLRGAVSFLMRALVPGKLVVVRPQFLQALHPLLRAMLFAREPVYVANASSIPRSRIDAAQQRTKKQAYLAGQQRLVVYFGFVYSFKGVDLLLDIADPNIDRVVIAGELDRDSDYGRRLLAMAMSPRWSGKVSFAGFLPPEELADLIAVSDAVILPFRLGGGEWNTSIHGAVANRAYVITTSKDRQGFDVQTGVHYAPIDDVGDMKSALALAPQRRPPLGASRLGADVDAWCSIARTHFDIYQRLLKSQVREAN